jgi:hypothetical protein
MKYLCYILRIGWYVGDDITCVPWVFPIDDDEAPLTMVLPPHQTTHPHHPVPSQAVRLPGEHNDASPFDEELENTTTQAPSTKNWSLANWTRRWTRWTLAMSRTREIRDDHTKRDHTREKQEEGVHTDSLAST